jgi:hypothetical protein
MDGEVEGVGQSLHEGGERGPLAECQIRDRVPAANIALHDAGGVRGLGDEGISSGLQECIGVAESLDPDGAPEKFQVVHGTSILGEQTISRGTRAHKRRFREAAEG